MLEESLKLLRQFTNHSYKAYIVGGFVRDYLLGIKSTDIDINTNATPKEIKEIFVDSCLPTEDYGSVTVMIKGIRFEITTFRKEIEYINNRKPVEIQYIDDLYEDLLRRDFTINTLCMDENGKIIDYLHGREDLNNKVIRCVGDAYEKLNEDSLRILRAIRFSTILDFKLCDDLVEAIKETKHLLKSLSFYRKKEELEKIFTSPNFKKGIQLLIDLELDKELGISNLEKVLSSDTVNLMGIWSMLNITETYPFNKNEIELINKINEVIDLNNVDPLVLYNYGLHVNSVAGEIKNQDKKEITEAYNNLVIKSRKDIDIDSNTIMLVLKKVPGPYLNEIYTDIEKEILYRRLNNNKNDIIKYIKDKYL